jgi:hypothetical protein
VEVTATVGSVAVGSKGEKTFGGLEWEVQEE